MVNGQNHKGSTYHIGKMLIDKIDGENTVTEFFLPKDFNEFCCGCTTCFMKGERLCPHFKKLEPITNAIDEADLLIFTSPVYVYHATGSMKALLDHYGWRWIVHRPDERMFSKRAVVIATAAGGGMKSTIRDIKDSLIFWGVPKVYTLGKAVMACSWDEVTDKKRQSLEKKTSKISAKLSKENFKAKASLKGRFFFTAMHFANKHGWNKADAEYWKAKGWTEKVRPFSMHNS